MVGRELLAFHRKEVTPSDEVMFEVRGLTKRHRYSDVSFKIHKGEIVAMAGLVGAGRSEVALGVFGCPPPDSGEVLVQNKRIQIKRAQDAMRAGIALAPEDRKSTGLVLGASVGTNVSMAVLPRLARGAVYRSESGAQSHPAFCEAAEHPNAQSRAEGWSFRAAAISKRS